jgi:tRNA dimethylallyltransferase
MLAEGFLDEVQTLRARADLHADLPAMRAVGYRQAWEYLDGATNEATFRDKALFATRQLAKRQLTWLRSELDARALETEHPQRLQHALAALGLFMDAPTKSSKA